MKYNKKWFSIIEILIWIFIFSLGMVWIFAIISSILRINDYNENYIIASNLANEELELVRNIRDSNYSWFKPYNLLNPNWNSYLDIDKFEIGQKYIVENDYSNLSDFPIKVEKIINLEEWEDKLNHEMLEYNLCIDSLNRYTYDCSTSWNKKTFFYRYISIEPVEYKEWWVTKTIDSSFLIRSKVIWYKKGYHEFEVKSIIADWKRL
jgi:hypothetical protein